MKDLTGKVAVVTGAASGIGLGLAERFAAEGMSVVLADVEEAALAAAEERVRAAGAEALAVPTDVSVAASVDELARRTLERFGAVHLVCNNAGVGSGGPAWEVPLAAWEWVLGVNLWGVVHGVRAFVPALLDQDEGHVVNTASAAGLVTTPGFAPYAASKHAVVAISEALHHDLALRGSAVKVSVLCPGFVRTNISDSERNWPSRLGSPPSPPDDPERQALRELVRQRLAEGVAPADVAALVVEAVRDERFWVFTDVKFAAFAAARLRDAVDGRNPDLPALG